MSNFCVFFKKVFKLARSKTFFIFLKKKFHGPRKKPVSGPNTNPFLPFFSSHSRVVDCAKNIADKTRVMMRVSVNSVANYKNKLQEHYQRLHLPLPRYEHKNGADSMNWTSTVILPNDKQQFRGCGATKKAADQQAAQRAWESVCVATRKTTPPQQFVSVATPKVKPKALVSLVSLVLWDLENSPGCTEWQSGTCQVEAFAGKLSSHATKDLRYLYPFVDTFHIVDSGMKDAVDHAISVRAGEWIAGGSSTLHTLYIVSRDRFSIALIDVMRQKLARTPPGERGANCANCVHCVHCVSMDECNAMVVEAEDKTKTEDKSEAGGNKM